MRMHKYNIEKNKKLWDSSRTLLENARKMHKTYSWAYEFAKYHNMRFQLSSGYTADYLVRGNDSPSEQWFGDDDVCIMI